MTYHIQRPISHIVTARQAVELGAGPASANTARPCYTRAPRAGLLWLRACTRSLPMVVYVHSPPPFPDGYSIHSLL
jgi:hypothetical protein